MEKQEFEVRFMTEFPPEFLRAARELYLENNWIDASAAPDFPRNAFAGSFLVAAAFAPDGRLAGVGRSLSDGVSDAFIQDVMTAKEFRRRGVGRLVTTALVEELKRRGVDWIGLVGVPGTEKFYASCGLVSIPGHTLWMAEEPKR